MKIREGVPISVDALIAQGSTEEEKKLTVTERLRGQTTNHGEKEKTPNDKFYVPVINLNLQHEWPSKPMEERCRFTDEVAMKTCLGNCCGVPGLKGGCCHLDPEDLEHVLGPVDETWIRDILKWFRKKGLNFSRSDVVIDYEEGRIIGETLFKDAVNNAVFSDRHAYPFMRFQVIGPRYVCKFMNPETYMCQIYEVRPEMCSRYLCQYVMTNFLCKTASHPNTWQKLR